MGLPDGKRVTFDYNYMMADFVGDEHGITGADLDSLAGAARRTHADLAARRADGTLPFFDLPYRDTTAIKSLAAELAGEFENFVLLGIGGSALGPIALHTALRHPCHNFLPEAGRGGRPRMFFLDNVDPDHFACMLGALDLRKTVFNVVTKSGGTAETMAQFMVARKMVRDALGESAVKEHFVCTTDPHKGNLRAVVNKEGLRALEVPPGVGGRFSVFTSVGLLPAAVSGIDVDKLLAGAADMDARCKVPDLRQNPAYVSAALQYILDTRKGKKISVMMPYSQSLRDIADWYRQIWAESIGKKHALDGRVVHTGQTPVKALGATDQHSQVQLYAEGPNDKSFTFLRVGSFGVKVEIPGEFPDMEGLAYLGGKTMEGLINAEQAATETALMKAGRPCAVLNFPVVDEHTVGQALYMLEVHTAFAGGLYGIDPFDQPGVEEGKLLTYAMMGRPGFLDKKREVEGYARRGEYTV